MDTATRMHFVAHVRELQNRAIAGDTDAAKSLACMALLKGSVPDDDPGGEVVDITAYRQLLAA